MNVPQGTYRILDANLNRLREGLRVLEERVRFIQDSSELTSTIKGMRHRIKELIEGHLDQQLLVQDRDSVGDVGAALDPGSEMKRSGLDSILHSNIKRVQEAARVLEEYGKLVNPELGKGFKELRFSAYNLEQDIQKAKALDFHLYLLAPGVNNLDPAITGGVDFIQFRMKEGDDEVKVAKAREICSFLKERNVPLIINDRPDICLMVGAAGVHLGQEDLPVSEARKVLGPGRIIGRSTHSLEQALEADKQDVDYIAIGPVFPTESKGRPVQAIGLDVVKQVVGQVSKPVVAIGGIDSSNLSSVMETRVKRVAVIGSILGSSDPGKSTRELREIIDNYCKEV